MATRASPATHYFHVGTTQNDDDDDDDDDTVVTYTVLTLYLML